MGSCEWLPGPGESEAVVAAWLSFPSRSRLFCFRCFAQRFSSNLNSVCETMPKRPSANITARTETFGGACCVRWLQTGHHIVGGRMARERQSTAPICGPYSAQDQTVIADQPGYSPPVRPGSTRVCKSSWYLHLCGPKAPELCEYRIHPQVSGWQTNGETCGTLPVWISPPFAQRL